MIGYKKGNYEGKNDGLIVEHNMSLIQCGFYSDTSSIFLFTINNKINIIKTKYKNKN